MEKMYKDYDNPNTPEFYSLMRNSVQGQAGKYLHRELTDSEMVAIREEISGRLNKSFHRMAKGILLKLNQRGL